MHCFDKAISRDGSASLKYDGRIEAFGTSDVMPMWVADMDFAAPDAVVEALQARVSHPVYGYSMAPESLYQALIDWMLTKHQWRIMREWIVLTPGVVPSLNLVVAALTQENAGIIVQPPVYFPFLSIAQNQRRRLIENPLVLQDDGLGHVHYQMDFAQLEACATEASLLMLCSPHNPVGRVWQKEELLALLAIAKKHDVIIVADEIHADLVYDNAQHHTLSRLAFELAPSSNHASHPIITAVSPSKTFNIPGLGLSALIVPDAAHRQAIQTHLARLAVSVNNPLSIIAFEAAYREDSGWLSALMVYLQTTRDEAVAFIRAHIPKINVVCPQGSYLLWLDCRKLNLNDKALALFFVQKAKIGLSSGAMFGRGGEGFMRMNIGTPRVNVMQALERLKSALE